MHRRIVIQIDELAGKVCMALLVHDWALSQHFNRFMRPCEVRLLERHLWQEAIHVVTDHGWRLL